MSEAGLELQSESRDLIMLGGHYSCPRWGSVSQPAYLWGPPIRPWLCPSGSPRFFPVPVLHPWGPLWSQSCCVCVCVSCPPSLVVLGLRTQTYHLSSFIDGLSPGQQGWGLIQRWVLESGHKVCLEVSRCLTS
jgi:hypothetical protein